MHLRDSTCAIVKSFNKKWGGVITQQRHRFLKLARTIADLANALYHRPKLMGDQYLE
jgi:predicted ATPase with chaperone activity